jgi:hypothetical protein
MLQTRVSQPRLRDFHLPPLGGLRACEAAARLMRTKKAAKMESNRSLVSGVL